MHISIYRTVLVFPFLFGTLFAQTDCLSRQINKQYETNESMLKQSEFETFWQKTTSSKITRRAVDILPVVVHIIHDQNTGNISDAKVIQAIQFLNQGFSNQGPYYNSNGVNCEIQFCLAKQDPNGNPSSGITRTNSALTKLTAESEDALLKGLIHWDAHCYINIYVVNEIISAIYGSGVQGYANGPSLHGSAVDGLVVEAALTGSASENTSTLIHEIGHYLGLLHTFEGGCKNDDCLVDGDKVCDTPPDASTAAVICNSIVNTCTTDTRSGLSQDLPDMVSNFMDYGSNFCKVMFTQGQKNRMKVALSQMRKSLLNCNSCEDPCPNPLTLNIVTDSLTAAIGSPFNIRTNSSIGVTVWSWYDNGSLVSNNSFFSHQFTSAGKHVIKLIAIGTDPKCIFSDSVCIEVNCPIPFSHSLRDTVCIPLNSIVPLQVQSNVVGHITKWYIDGILNFTGDLFNWQNNRLGPHKIYFTIENGNCLIKSALYNYLVGCSEICDNQIDDDGDDLIDGYDPDCCKVVNDFYYDPCDESCPKQLKNSFSSIKTKWKTDASVKWFETNTPFVGDMDNDGDVEVVGSSYFKFGVDQKGSADILIVDGKTGNLQAKFTYLGGPFAGNLAIADVDRNGYGDIFSTRNGLERIEYLGDTNFVRRWRATTSTNYQQASLADFNNDGIPEVYITNGIWNAVNGTRYIAQDPNKSIGKTSLIFGNSGSTAVDILKDNACPDCEGLELVTGNEVYAVDINTLNPPASKLTLIHKAKNELDGYTSIADFDLDGDLDALVLSSTQGPNLSGQVTFYVWDVQTDSILFPRGIVNSFLANTAQAAIGELVGDLRPEIVFNTRDSIYAFTTNLNRWVKLFQIPNVDISGMASLSVYDFNGDTKQEVIIRGEKDFFIINGQTGAVIFSYPCISGTGVEYPTVADVDGDLEAELLFSCDSYLVCLEPNPGSWTLTRPVMNQAIYFNVNVNDDLTIPQFQQAHHIVKNHNRYLSQYSYLAPNGSDAIISNSKVECTSDSVQISMSICNQGPGTIADSLFVSIYNSNPYNSSASLLYRINFGYTVLEKDSCKSFSFTIPNPLINNISIVVNQNKTVSTPFPSANLESVFKFYECNFLNNSNIISIPSKATIDLGPDEELCDFESKRLSVPSGFQSYLWIDGSRDSVFTALGPGTYWVEVQDQCGNKLRDSITLRLLSSSKIELGPDLSICKGDTVKFSSTLQQLKWVGNFTLGCDSCSSIQFIPDSSGVLQVYGKFSDHCYSYDSVYIEVNAGIQMKLHRFVCAGDSVLINNTYFYNDTTLKYKISSQRGCDTLIEQQIQFDTTRLELGQDRLLCPGSSVQLFIPIRGKINWRASQDLSCLNCANPVVTPSVFPSTYYVSVVTDSFCTYFDSITINAINVPGTRIDKVLCLNDSIQINNQWIKKEGVYLDSLKNSLGCDSILTYHIRFDSLQLRLPTFPPICEGDSVVIQLNGFRNYQWHKSNDISCDSCSSIVIKPKAGTNEYILTATSALSCISRDTITIDVLSRYIQSDTVIICNGDSLFWNGQWRRPAQSYSYKSTSPLACDSLFNLQLKEFPVVPFELGNTRKQCEGDIINFNRNGLASGIWRSNLAVNCDSCQEIQIKCTKNQWLVFEGLDTNHCPIYDSINLEVSPVFYKINEYILCPGDSILLNQKWYSSPTEQEIKLKSQDQCDSILNTKISFYTPIQFNAPDTIYAFLNEKILINYFLSNQLSKIEWSGDFVFSCTLCLETECRVDKEGRIHVVTTDINGCEQEFELVVKLKQDEQEVYIPNIFSPNGDQLNDFLDIKSGDQDAAIEYLRIFDRWGELVHESKNIYVRDYLGWDGRFRNQACLPAVYVLDAVFSLRSGKKIHITTDIQLIR